MDNEDLPVRPDAVTGQYRLPWPYVFKCLGSAAILRRRSFARDSQAAVAAVTPPIEVRGAENIPCRDPCLLTCNHYSRPGFGAWWLTMTLSAAVASHRAPEADPEIHWVMTAAWTFPNSRWRRLVLRPISHWAFERVARVYGFVTMPPMPPDPNEVEARAASVLRTVRLARKLASKGGMVGLAPEGRDVPGGLGEPPPGAGEFIALLVSAGLPILPVGVAERGERLRLSFGPQVPLEIPAERAMRDRVVSDQVMAAIARLLP